MQKKITIYDVAEKLNVSTATVNRALSGKPKVGEETRRLIIETAREMGYKANKAAMSLARKTIRIGVLMDNLIHDFNEKVVEGARKACEELADFNVEGNFQVLDRPNSKDDMARIVKRMLDSEFDGIILMGSPEYDLIINEICARQVPVVTIISDYPGCKRLFSVRTHGRISGKIAAEMLSTWVGSKQVAVFTGYKDRGIHKENLDGFAEQAKNTPVNLAAVYENYDDPVIAYHTTDKLIRDYPDLGGLYISSANSITVCKKLVETGHAGKIKIVASDVFPELVEYMRKGVIHATVFQEPYNIGNLAFRHLYEHIAEGKSFESDILLRPQIVLNGNLELYI
jgi:LacI family transcriptional regulator